MGSIGRAQRNENLRACSAGRVATTLSSGSLGVCFSEADLAHPPFDCSLFSTDPHPLADWNRRIRATSVISSWHETAR